MRYLSVLLLFAWSLPSQVYSPSVLLRDQPDASNLKSFAETIVRNAGARTPHAKAEALWRFFLTDGRFVKPGFWYHIAGWAYEEPVGEVLDPIKLLNSYGFGLCYHIAPLLEAVFEAAGFEDARVWFLTGHTVAEVYYEGSWHYFDSDMMGYNVAGDGAFKGKSVASVRDLEKDPSIIVGKMQDPRTVKQGSVDSPWYPADVRAGAMKDLAGLFTSSNDNFLFPFTRYSVGHDMNFVLRPGEKIVRYFEPEEPSLYYLPYTFDGKEWREFPREIARYGINTEDGPRSQKDKRTWGTGRIEYTPPVLAQDRELLFSMPSPWVIIDARFTAEVDLKSAESWVTLETSTDGRSWLPAGKVVGPHKGAWAAEPQVIARSAHGRLTAVSGTYGYQVRVRRSDSQAATISRLSFTTRFQLNPRTLPALTDGANHLVYRSGPPARRDFVPVDLSQQASPNLKLIDEAGQQMLCPTAEAAEKIFQLDAGTGFDFGARFLDIRNGLAPDKLTAETRTTGVSAQGGSASIEWATAADGPWKPAWTFPAKPTIDDPEPVHRVLRWPEAFVSVRDVPVGAKAIYVRLRSSGPCVDNIRAAVWRKEAAPAGKVRVTHTWEEDGARRQHTETVGSNDSARTYEVSTGRSPRNVSLTIESVP